MLAALLLVPMAVRSPQSVPRLLDGDYLAEPFMTAFEKTRSLDQAVAEAGGFVRARVAARGEDRIVTRADLARECGAVLVRRDGRLEPVEVDSPDSPARLPVAPAPVSPGAGTGADDDAAGPDPPGADSPQPSPEADPPSAHLVQATDAAAAGLPASPADAVRVVSPVRFTTRLCAGDGAAFVHVGDHVAWISHVLLGGRYKDPRGGKYVFGPSGQATFAGRRHTWRVPLDASASRLELDGVRHAYTLEGGTLRIFDLHDDGQPAPEPRWSLRRVVTGG